MHNKQADRALCELYLLPSRREKIRKIKTARDKKLIALNKEQYKIRDTLRNLGFEDLILPIQRGFKRTFVLRYDVAIGKHAQFYQEILNAINTVQYSYRKDFRVKKRRRGKNRYKIREQHLDLKSAWEFNKLELNDKQKELFTETEIYYPDSKRTAKFFVFKEPWRFVLKVMPNMITKVRIQDSELESRYDEIDRYLEKNNLNHQISHLKGWRGWRYHMYAWDSVFMKPKYKFNPLKGKSIKTIEYEYQQDILES